MGSVLWGEGLGWNHGLRAQEWSHCVCSQAGVCFFQCVPNPFPNTLSPPIPPSPPHSSILDMATRDPRVSPHVDSGCLLLAGHSRGGKLSALAAAGDPRVRGMALLDPVDVTGMTPMGACGGGGAEG